jgi:hypothetical protein
MQNNISIEEIKRGNKKRNRLFIEAGLRPLQIVMSIGVLLYVLSVISAVWYYWPQAHHLAYLLSPVFVVLAWAFHFNYHRNNFKLLAIVAGVSLLMSLRYIATDRFCLANSLGLAMVVVIALIICAKMKDPRFSRSDGA